MRWLPDVADTVRLHAGAKNAELRSNTAPVPTRGVRVDAVDEMSYKYAFIVAVLAVNLAQGAWGASVGGAVEYDSSCEDREKELWETANQLADTLASTLTGILELEAADAAAAFVNLPTAQAISRFDHYVAVLAAVEKTMQTSVLRESYYYEVAMARVTLGILYDRMGRHDKAQAEYRKGMNAYGNSMRNAEVITLKELQKKAIYLQQSQNQNAKSR